MAECIKSHYLINQTSKEKTTPVCQAPARKVFFDGVVAVGVLNASITWVYQSWLFGSTNSVGPFEL